MKNVGNNKKGFTIIEVVLVLAIAGLIFLIVFLAVPALQANRRDTQRRSDLGRFLAQLEQYAANRNGTYPTTAQANATGATGFKQQYMKSNTGGFNDPSTGTAYTISGAAPTAAGQIQYNTNSQCDASGDFSSGGGTRSVAAVIFLEGGGTYCQDNQ